VLILGVSVANFDRDVRLPEFMTFEWIFSSFQASAFVTKSQ